MFFINDPLEYRIKREQERNDDFEATHHDFDSFAVEDHLEIVPQ